MQTPYLLRERDGEGGKHRQRAQRRQNHHDVVSGAVRLGRGLESQRLADPRGRGRRLRHRNRRDGLAGGICIDRVALEMCT